WCARRVPGRRAGSARRRQAARPREAPARARAPRPPLPKKMSELSHVDETGEVRMVDVGGKPVARRRAVAGARVRMLPQTARRLRELPKGDALATAQLAGIMAAKRTAELIPLCHTLPLS